MEQPAGGRTTYSDLPLELWGVVLVHLCGRSWGEPLRVLCRFPDPGYQLTWSAAERPTERWQLGTLIRVAASCRCALCRSRGCRSPMHKLSCEHWHRLLRKAAAAAAKDVLSYMLDAGPDLPLASSLLAELWQGKPRLQIQSPSPALADLPNFLRRTGMYDVSVEAKGLAASARADSVLRRCATITSLACLEGFWPHFWPPNLRTLDLYFVDPDEYNSEAEVAEQQQAQLLRLQDATQLRHLALHTAMTPAIQWPAALARALPPSLRDVRICLDVKYCRSSRAVDLSAFSGAAGCSAEVEVSIDGLSPFDQAGGPAALAAVRALGSFHTLWMDGAVSQLFPHFAGLPYVQCCTLNLHRDAVVTQLPAAGHLTLTSEFSDERRLRPMACEWAALAGPGVRCLGDKCQLLSHLAVTGCTGLPALDAPWALAVWADMRVVRGLPASCFVEEAPGKHVWRNAAAAGLPV